jgi:hypothetical protein
MSRPRGGSGAVYCWEAAGQTYSLFRILFLIKYSLFTDDPASGVIRFTMADPLSLVASVIAIATAAGQISKAISRLKHIGELPSQVYALKNEVSDLEVVLRQVRYALEQKTWTPDNRQESLDVILVRTKTQLTDLTKALEKVANTLAASKTKVFRRSALWWKWKTVFQTFQGDIRAIKESLIVMLGASNS